jgi:hypothetical protein
MIRPTAVQLVICPGIHPEALTAQFLTSLQGAWLQKNTTPFTYLIAPADLPIYSPVALLTWLRQHCRLEQPLLLLSYSAGVVRAIGAAWGWQLVGGKIAALIAMDGWGVVLSGHFPIYRLSHDEFTHWSSHLLGGGLESFYAQPGVTHLDLWASPDQARGYWVGAAGQVPSDAAAFLVAILQRHLQN